MEGWDASTRHGDASGGDARRSGSGGDSSVWTGGPEGSGVPVGVVSWAPDSRPAASRTATSRLVDEQPGGDSRELGGQPSHRRYHPYENRAWQQRDDTARGRRPTRSPSPQDAAARLNSKPPPFVNRAKCVSALAQILSHNGHGAVMQELQEKLRTTVVERASRNPTPDATSQSNQGDADTSPRYQKNGVGRESCRVGWCTQPPKRYGLCWTHGGRKKCYRTGCQLDATRGESCELHRSPPPNNQASSR